MSEHAPKRPLLPRSHLLKRIQTALVSSHVVVTAPAGYGKSTLLRALAARLPHSVYLPLTPADADLPVLQQRIAEIPDDPAVIILDDTHHLADAPETLAWLRERLADALPRWVLSGRQTLPALLFDEHGALYFMLGKTELAFRLEESKALLQTAGSPAAEAQAAQWHTRTQGWPLALALRQQVLAQGYTLADGETPAQLFDALAARLFGGLPPPLLHFMQYSAVPLRVNAALAAELLGTTPARAAALLEEVLRKNLFLEAADLPGWFRYHDLIREYLLRQFEPAPVQERAIDWFAGAGDLPGAIEQALASGMTARAAALMAALPPDFVHTTGKYRTLRRWVNALDPQTRAAHPLILRNLAVALAEHSDRTESFQLLREALGYAHGLGDAVVQAEIVLATASIHISAGNASGALEALRTLENPTLLAPDLQRKYLKSLGAVHYFLSHFRQAQSVLEQALALSTGSDAAGTARLRQNLIVTALQPLGEFERAEQQITLYEPVMAHQVAGRIWMLITKCWQFEATGDWARLAAALDEIGEQRRQSEELEDEDEGILVLHLYLATGAGEFAQASELLHKLDTGRSENPDLRMYVEICRVWLLRRTGRYGEAIAAADRALGQEEGAPYTRGMLAMEREAARLQAEEPGVFDADIYRLIPLRTRPWLLRLHVLLALRCHRSGDRRWQRHARAVLRTSERYGYANILVSREPDLGARFWTLCIEEGIGLEQARAALRSLGRNGRLDGLIRHAAPAVRLRAAQTLAAIGDESAIPLLAEALSREQDAAVRGALESALDTLEALPPPTLHVMLLGEFRAVRGDKPILPGDWQRPAARRLFQYFVLHGGKPLPRERILEDLWPESAPDAARSSFKTVYSWLRKAIEPYLRPKSPSRYVQAEGEIYTFNPLRSPDLVQCDVWDFEQIVRSALKGADDYDVRPLSPAFLAALEGWQPLLPELNYEPWAAAVGERLQTLYVQGCLYAAGALLDVDKPFDAAAWAERAVTAAPWLEEGWQELMRAQARQGNRSLALRTYAAAVAALQRELDAPPSAALQWLAKRLRAEQEI